MGQHARYIAPVKRRERKTVFADSRWKISIILPQFDGERQENWRKKNASVLRDRG